MAIARRHHRPAKPAPAPAEVPSWAEAASDELVRMQTDGDRLLLAIMQTSLSLIGFGFTIYQIFSDALAKSGLTRAGLLPSRIGISLLVLGLILLSGGLWANARARRRLVERRARLVARGAVAPGQAAGFSPIVVVAWLLLGVALTTFAAILIRLLG